MIQTIVGVIRGGISGEYDVSLQTGGAVLRNLPKRYKAIDIVIDKNGVWHRSGIAHAPEKALLHIDVVFNALHGYYGEDGKLQKFLYHLQIPYTGSGAVPSAMGMHKMMAKNVFTQQGMKTPYAMVLKRNGPWSREAVKVYRSVPHPSVVKPISGGSSLGTRVVNDFHELLDALNHAFHYSESVIVEEYISGREATCGVLDHFRGEEHYALPPVEIIPPTGRFFDYEVKYNGSTREICPSFFSEKEKAEIMRCAILAHKALGLRHYSRSDFIISSRGVHILEVNTLPGLTEESLLPKACTAVGCHFSDFLDHTIQLALSGR